MVITQEAARARIELMEKIRRACVELDYVANELAMMQEKNMARSINDASQIAHVIGMRLRESISE